jgi:hypothetical protein
MFEVYAVNSHIENKFNVDFDFDNYDYFLDCDAVANQM